MSTKRKVRYDRIIILTLAVLLTAAVLGFGVYKLLDHFLNQETEQKEVIPAANVTTSGNIKVSLLDYSVYTGDRENLGFNFIVASLKFDSDEPISFDLADLQTSEKIHLDAVGKYINELEEKNYRLNKLDISNVIVSNENTHTANIFIPYTTQSSTLRILNSNDASMIEFDLSKNTSDISTLKFDTQQQIEVGDTNVTVSSCFVSTMMLHNDQEYQIPSTLSIYTFVISVNKAEGNVMITDARFVAENDSEVISCLDETYESVKVANVLGKKLVEGENGALFFETRTPSGGPDYTGYLMLMFSNSNDWVKIPTILE